VVLTHALALEAVLGTYAVMIHVSVEVACVHDEDSKRAQPSYAEDPEEGGGESGAEGQSCEESEETDSSEDDTSHEDAPQGAEMSLLHEGQDDHGCSHEHKEGRTSHDPGTKSAISGFIVHSVLRFVCHRSSGGSGNNYGLSSINGVHCCLKNNKI